MGFAALLLTFVYPITMLVMQIDKILPGFSDILHLIISFI